MKKVVSEISGVVFSLPWLVAKDNLSLIHI